MTVIAWDGNTLAADRQGTVGNSISVPVRKLFRANNGNLVGVSGDGGYAMSWLAWYQAGAKPEDLPSFQLDKDNWCAALVITPDRRIFRYEKAAHPWEIEAPQAAIGCGMDFAMMAMYLGKTARDAVLLTSDLNPFCGHGVDTLTF